MKKLLLIALLIAGCEEPAQHGCLDSQACNYDADATIDNNSCIYVSDCAGVCGGTLEYDICNVCGGGVIDLNDCAVCSDGIQADCNGICNGPAVIDECGVCNGDNSICTVCATYFSATQSMNQTYYFFTNVMINGENIDDEDWVGAFKGNICVGTRIWDTSGLCSDDQYADLSTCEGAGEIWEWNACNGGVCDLPAMGDDGSADTEGYMQSLEIPTFKIYDKSENIYYAAEASGIVNRNNGECVGDVPNCMGFVNTGFINISTLEAVPNSAVSCQ